MQRDHVFAGRLLLQQIGSFVQPQDDRWLCGFSQVHVSTHRAHKDYNQVTRACHRIFMQVQAEHHMFQGTIEYRDAFDRWFDARYLGRR